MCDFCEKIKANTGQDVQKEVAGAIHHTKALITWMDGARIILDNSDGKNFHSAASKILKALEILSHVNFIFLDVIVTSQDVEFARFLLMMVHSVSKNKAQVLEIEKGVMSDPDKVKVVKDLLETLKAHMEDKESPSEKPEQRHRFN